MLRIKELRKAHGLNQSRLSQMVGVGRSTIAMWESGKSCPDIESLIMLSNIFSVSVDYLLGKDEPQPPADAPSPAQKFMESLPLDSLDDEELQKLVEYAEFLVSQKRKKK